MSYGANFEDMFRRTADIVDKILRGAKPSDIPVEQPTKFDLVVNRTTAKAIGVIIPGTVLARADEVIDETARLHHASWQRGGLAAFGARAATDDAGGWICPRWVGRHVRVACRGVPERTQRNRLLEGQNVSVEYHWLEGQYDRLPQLMADLVQPQVAVIATPGNVTTVAAKAATATIPIVFGIGDNPVRLGLVASLARPGGNATGINFFFQEVVAKRLRLLHELVPKAVRIVVLVNPANIFVAENTVRDVQQAAPALGLQIQTLNASTNAESTQLLFHLATNMPMRCSSRVTHSSSAGECS